MGERCTKKPWSLPWSPLKVSLIKGFVVLTKSSSCLEHKRNDLTSAKRRGMWSEKMQCPGRLLLVLGSGPEIGLGRTLLRVRGSLCSLVGRAHIGGSTWPFHNSSQRP